MAELELLAAPAPAGVVAADLLVLGLDDGHQGVGVGGIRPLDQGLAPPFGGRRSGRRLGPAQPAATLVPCSAAKAPARAPVSATGSSAAT